MINKLSKQIHEANIKKGFYENEKNIGEMLALIHSEVSEALEADREQNYANIDSITLGGLADRDYGITFHDENRFLDKFSSDVKNTFEDELADIMIRVMDLAAYKGINLEFHIKAKMRYNALRPYKHGKEY